MLIIFQFLNDSIFQIGLVIAIYVYATILVILFRSHFETSILSVLPWNLAVYKQAFFEWAIIGGIILLIPVTVFLALNISIWTPLQLLFYGSVFLYVYDVKIDKAIILLGKQPVKTDLDEAIGILLLGGVFLSWKYPIISLGSFMIIWFLFKRRNVGTSNSTD